MFKDVNYNISRLEGSIISDIDNEIFKTSLPAYTIIHNINLSEVPLKVVLNNFLKRVNANV